MNEIGKMLDKALRGECTADELVELRLQWLEHDFHDLHNEMTRALERAFAEKVSTT